MVGRVRCSCGQYMGFVRWDASRHGCGGLYVYRCGRCGAEASVYSRHGADDELVSGVLVVGGTERKLVYDYDGAEEWRVA